MPMPWPGPRAGDCAERWVGCPAGDGAPPGTKVQLRRSGVLRRSARSHGVEAWKCHVTGADLAREGQLPKPACGAVVRTKKSMMRAVDGDHGEIIFGQDGAVER